MIHDSCVCFFFLMLTSLTKVLITDIKQAEFDLNITICYTVLIIYSLLQLIKKIPIPSVLLAMCAHLEMGSQSCVMFI